MRNWVTTLVTAVPATQRDEPKRIGMVNGTGTRDVAEQDWIEETREEREKKKERESKRKDRQRRNHVIIYVVRTITEKTVDGRRITRNERRKKIYPITDIEK